MLKIFSWWQFISFQKKLPLSSAYIFEFKFWKHKSCISQTEHLWQILDQSFWLNFEDLLASEISSPLKAMNGLKMKNLHFKAASWLALHYILTVSLFCWWILEKVLQHITMQGRRWSLKFSEDTLIFPSNSVNLCPIFNFFSPKS